MNGPTTRTRFGPLATAAGLGCTLAAVAFGFVALSGPPPGDSWSLLWVLEEAAARLGLLLPFGTFVAGLTALGAYPRARARGRLLVDGAVIGLLAYALTSWVTPVAEHALDTRRGADVTTLYPFGPETPGGLLRHRAVLAASPPAAPSFSVSRPLAWPVSAVDYQLHVPAAFVVFALLNALLGFRVAVLTEDEPRLRRRTVRWLAGLSGGVIYLMANVISGASVVARPDASGVLAAWLPLIVPLALLWFVGFAARRAAGAAPEARTGFAN